MTRPGRVLPLVLLLTTAAAAAPPPPPEAPLNVRVDAALVRAARALAAAQDDDGAWRSTVYGNLRDGVTLTPPVLKTLLLGATDDDTDAAARRGAAYLMTWVDEDGTIPRADRLEYPVYTASMAAIAMHRLALHDPRAAVARDAWIALLRQHQLDESRGWREDDLAYGGWGYAVRPPHRPADGRPRPYFDADLSSTLFAVGALRVTGVGEDDPAIRRALRFVLRCQNYAEPGAAGPHDDGGFHLTPTNVAQNKGGAVPGTDRLHSYGSATADGLRALRRCGLPADHPRVQAAEAWLRRYFRADGHPGRFAPGHEDQREAPYFYYAWSLAHALRLQGVAQWTDETGRTRVWSNELAEALLERQRPDGTWVNPSTFVREDEPIIATMFAAAALANCRDGLADATAMHP